ncbi:MAG: AbrB/MazE/SpoVT family DNA-binding domain-containing protein [Croceibacterium sp.]
MGKEYRAKVFKSGNSLALRLPAELRLEEGSTMILREEQTGYSFERVDAPKAKLDVSSFWGTAPWLEPLPPEFREFEERPSSLAARKAKGNKQS